jgi:hypothetical protein
LSEDRLIRVSSSLFSVIVSKIYLNDGVFVANFPYKLENEDIESNHLEKYQQLIKKAQTVLETTVTPLLDEYFFEYNPYFTQLDNKELDINYSNPMIYTNKALYTLYMLLIEYSNQFWFEDFLNTKKKVIVLPRCLTGPNFDFLKVKRTKIGWHKITDSKDEETNAWKLSQLVKDQEVELYITMGNRFKEPNFIKVFRNLRKKYGHFGLIAVACIPELAFGNTYIMELGIPSHAVPLFYSGCSKWHGSAAIKTEFPLHYILKVLSLES